MFPISLFNLRSVFTSKSIHGSLRRRISYFSLRFRRETIRNEYTHNLPIKTLVSYNIINERCMAGHSKWQNVKHIKAEKDRLKTNMCNKYSRLVRYAVRENGPDPKLNTKLANLLEDARKHNVSKDTLENAMKKGNNKKTKSGSMEILAPGGCMVLVEYETDNISTTRHEVKVLCKKYNANVMSGEGRWRAVYEQKGILTAVKELNGEQLNEEKALDSAIEAGAEEVQMKENEEGRNFLEFVCAPDDLHKVKKELERLYEVEESYVAYIPTTTVQLSDEDMTLVDGFLEEMGNLPDVVRIYENVQ